MNTRFMQLAVLAIGFLGLSPVYAGYWHDSSSTVWRNSYGECWRTGYWTPEMIIVGCDGKVADVAAPEPMARPEPAAPPEPVAMVPAAATVNFAFDSADLGREATAAVDTLLQQAGSKGRIKAVRLTGHADRIGTEGYNVDLSLRRASAVSDYLVQRAGVDPQAVEIAGKGESQPLVGCEGVYGAAAIRCLAPNRRVDVVLDLF